MHALSACPVAYLFKQSMSPTISVVHGGVYVTIFLTVRLMSGSLLIAKRFMTPMVLGCWFQACFLNGSCSGQPTSLVSTDSPATGCPNVNGS
mmetsp:Transcript_10373/g.18040  ORF Transcript_10373/g.18040 Transcript_10373/m.18040 type:complete len:92 (+) Transcript_10373:882-1157(+)